MTGRAARWLLAAGLGWIAIVGAQADAPQTVSVRVGNHEGYGRVVFHLPPRIGYSVTQEGQHAIVKFTAELAVGQAAAIPRNVLGITTGKSQADFTLAPGAILHDWRTGDLVVIDVLDAAPDKEPGTKATPVAAATAAAPPAQAAPAPPRQAAEPPAAPSPPARPAQISAAPPPPPAQPSQASATPPPTPTQPDAAPPPSPATPTSAAAPTEAPAAEDGLKVAGDAQLGVAAFRRGNTALIVFDQRRDIDLTQLRDNPVFGAATVELLPTATVVSMRMEPDTSLALARTGNVWHITAVTSEARPHPIQASVTEDRLVLATSAPGSVVAVADPLSGTTLLVGTQRREGEAVLVGRHAPEFSLVPTWQGVVVQANADTVGLRPVAQGFALTGVANVSTPPDAADLLAHGGGLTRRFDFADQPPAILEARLRRQVAEAAAAPPLARAPLRQAAARTMIALGLGAEAEALLGLAATDDPHEANSPDNAALTAIAALLAQRPNETEGLDEPRLEATDDIAFWRAVRLAQQQEGSAHAAAVFASALPLLLAYPKAIAERVSPLAAETLVAAGELPAATALLDARKTDGTLDLARAMLLEAHGDNAAALAAYDRLAMSPDQSMHARAAVRAVELRLASGATDAKQAADRLESLLYAWRGDQRERALRERLAALKARAGDWRSALGLLRETEALFPEDKTALHSELAALFTALLRDDVADALPPLELVSVVEENADLLPPGAEGEALQAKLADRLLTLDLPKRAGPVIEKLSQVATSAVARAGFGARLAELRLREGDPAGALAAIDASAATDLPQDLLERRTLLAAAAYARRGENDLALTALRKLDTPAAAEAQAAILERANDWPAAQHALADYAARTIPPDGALDASQRQTLLRLATAAARAGDAAALTALRQREMVRMGGGPLADMFRLLTADPVHSAADLKRSAQEAALARDLPAQLKALEPLSGQAR